MALTTESEPMGTPLELFEIDNTQGFGIRKTIKVIDPSTREKIGADSVLAKLIIDRTTGSKYLAFYIPSPAIADYVLNDLPKLVLKALEVGGTNEIDLPRLDGIEDYSFAEDGDRCELIFKEIGGAETSSEAFPFSGRVIIYANFDMLPEHVEKFSDDMRKQHLNILFRGRTYAFNQMTNSAPKVFISHASADKDGIARPLASELRARNIDVWYDEYSLVPGCSLRESIDRGILECDHCILILTPNFLSKGGWTKQEYNSIFTREMVQEKRLVLPIWSGVSVGDVLEYSPILADTYAAQFDGNIPALCNELMRALYPQTRFA